METSETSVTRMKKPRNAEDKRVSLSDPYLRKVIARK